MSLIGFFLLLLVLVCLCALWFFRGENLERYDADVGEHFTSSATLTPERQAVLDILAGIDRSARGLGFRQRLATLRERFDNLFPGKEFAASFTSLQAAGIPAEWVQAANADGNRRLLYLHGGAWLMGSPKSHRSITSRLSQVTGAAVLAIDYRLLPESSRLAGIEDCRAAYRWLLDNGPDGPSAARRMFVAGDSAGGNLTLMLVAWVRDVGLRLPDAALAFSPATDATLSSPTLRSNLGTDPMLAPMFGKLARVPKALMLLFTWWVNRIPPNDPRTSPVFGDLSGLPPILIHASACEMLLGDARRYTNKAIAAGSPVRLQTWAHMVHVWQIFDPELPEARDAFEEIGKFFAEVAAD